MTRRRVRKSERGASNATHQGAPCDPADHASHGVVARSPTDAEFAKVAAFFRAASDVARLKLLMRLSSGEWCVSELARATGAGMSTVSQQLRVLRVQQLVKQRRVAKHVYYALADEHVERLIRSAMEHATERRAENDGP